MNDTLKMRNFVPCKPPWFWWGHEEKTDAMFSHSKVNGSRANLRCLYIPLKMLWLTSPKNVKVDLNKFPETELFIPASSKGFDM